MKNDILRDFLLQNRYLVEAKEWSGGGCVEQISLDTLPFNAPVVGSYGSGEKYLNSGGRSILVESGNSHSRAYKLKGMDPRGKVMASYFVQKMKDLNEENDDECRIQLAVDDVMETGRKCSEDIYTSLKDGVLGKHNDDPFGVLTLEKVKNEKNVLDILGSSYEKVNFFPPQKPSAIYTYNGMDFNSDKTASFLTELPLSIGSDLRLTEFNRLLREKYRSLKGNKEKFSKEKAMRKLYEEIYKHVGLNARITFDNRLMPLESSYVSSNFAIHYGGENKEIIVSRVDHSSTKTNANMGKSYIYWNSSKIVDCQNPFLSWNDARIIQIFKKLGVLRNFKNNFELGWNGEVEPLNNYIEVALLD